MDFLHVNHVRIDALPFLQLLLINKTSKRYLKLFINSVFLKSLSQSVVHVMTYVGSGGRAVERWTVNRGDGGSIPPTAVSKLRQFLHPTFACVFRKRH